MRASLSLRSNSNERIIYTTHSIPELIINQIQKKAEMATITVEKGDIEQLTEFTKNTHWLLENIDSLREKYHGRYVAVLDSGKRIVDAYTMEELNEKITRLGKSPETCAIDFVTRERYLLIL